MSRPKKKGFTLVELVVVLVIMTVILGIAIPSVLHYMKMAEFQKNEENAKTVYLAAESKRRMGYGQFKSQKYGSGGIERCGWKKCGYLVFSGYFTGREICVDAGCNDVCGDTGSAFFFTE